MPSPSGEEVALVSRKRYMRDIETIRNSGIMAYTQLLAGVDYQDLADGWATTTGPLLTRLIDSQQYASRTATMTYLTAVGVGVGLGPGTALAPAASRNRNGRLPSGMFTSSLVSAIPLTVAHRIENGLTAPEAWKTSINYVGRAVREAPYSESRLTTTDVLKEGSLNWEEFDDVVTSSDLDNFSVETEARRVRRNTTAKSAAAQNKVGQEMFPARWLARYSRVPSPGACSFCLMLATKGPVFYADSFSGRGASSSRLNAKGDARVHANCRCKLAAEPERGMYKNVVFGDANQYMNVQWKDARYKRTYTLSKLLNGKKVLPALAQSDAMLAA